MILYIDTANKDLAIVKLIDKGKVVSMEEKAKRFQAQQVLFLLTKLLQQNRIELATISKIKVNLGPGSFTGLRVGVAVANCLGWLLNVPVNNCPRGKGVLPRYA